ncbi:MAG: protein kinase domain-containing protein [Acidimicrobiia bacterium]
MTGTGPGPDSRYEVLERIRSSAGCETVLALDTQTQQEVALKVFHVDPGIAPAVLQEVQSTASTLGRAPSDHIVPVVDVRASDGRIALVSHAGRGATLNELMSSGTRFPVGHAAHVGHAIALGLDAAHRVGIVHGALTPESVVQTTTGSMAVTDFGFARHPTAIVHSPTWTAYAAPEQLTGGAVDERSDLYALGGLLHLMLTGRPPFTDFDESLLRQHKLAATPAPPSQDDPTIPPALDALVTRLLDRDPDRRPQSAADVAAELVRFEEPTIVAPPVLRTETTITDLTPRPHRRSPWLAIGLVVAVLLVGGIIAAVLLTRDDSPGTVAVPSVIGQTAAKAAANLQAQGLAASTVTAPNDSFAAGIVVAQDPAAGPKVRRGTVIILTVSSGPTPTTTSTTTAPTTTTTSTTTTTTTTTTVPAPPTT